MELVDRLIDRLRRRHHLEVTSEEADAAIDTIFDAVYEMSSIKSLEHLEPALEATAEVYLSLMVEAKSAGDTRVVNRVRGGGSLVQRRKKVSGKRGFTWNSKKKRLLRIDALERLHRSRGAKIGSIKRKSEKAVSKINRARSMKMRKALGFDRSKKR